MAYIIKIRLENSQNEQSIAQLNRIISNVNSDSDNRLKEVNSLKIKCRELQKDLDNARKAVAICQQKLDSNSNPNQMRRQLNVDLFKLRTVLNGVHVFEFFTQFLSDLRDPDKVPGENDIHRNSFEDRIRALFNYCQFINNEFLANVAELRDKTLILRRNP